MFDREEQRLNRLGEHLPPLPKPCPACGLPIARHGLWGVPFYADEEGNPLHEICDACGRPFPNAASRDPEVVIPLLGCGSKCYVGIDPL